MAPMQSAASDDAHRITSLDQIRELLGEPRTAQLTKSISALDEHCRRWIAASPFLVLGSADAQGKMDLSPKGDPPGFVQVLDDTTLAVPDRPGNKRFDTFANVLENPQVALIFAVPGRGETLRVAGTAHISADPELLEALGHNGRPATLALIVSVDAVMFHCGKSMIRSKLWQPEAWPSIAELASYAECVGAHSITDETVAEMEARFATWPLGNELY